MVVTHMKDPDMTKNDQGGRSLAPQSGGPVDEPGSKPLRDPIALAMEIAGGDDLSLDDLIAFRRQPIDLKASARNAKALQSEAFRLSLTKELDDTQTDFACGGLQIMTLSFVALTAIWPADDLDRAEAKLALAERTGALHHAREKGLRPFDGAGACTAAALEAGGLRGARATAAPGARRAPGR